MRSRSPLFKTMKYCPDYPASFTDIESARAWCRTFFPWYNDEHRHEGIAFFTPADVHVGRHVDLGKARQRTLDLAYAAHPERFVKGPPTSATVPEEVWINRPSEQSVAVGIATAPEGRPQALPGGRGGPGEEGPRLPLVAARTAPNHPMVVIRRETHRSARKRVPAS